MLCFCHAFVDAADAADGAVTPDAFAMPRFMPLRRLRYGVCYRLI